MKFKTLFGHKILVLINY